MGKREWRKEYIVAASRIALVASLKPCMRNLRKTHQGKKSTTLSSRHLQSFRLSHVILQEPEQGLTIKDMIPLNIAKLSH